MYCLEADEESGSELVNTSCGDKSKSRYLHIKDGTTDAVNTDSIPDLEHSSNLSEGDYDTNSSGNLSRWASSIELPQGFGYGNEQGELVLEISGGAIEQAGGNCFSSDGDYDRIVRRYYNYENFDGDDSIVDNEDDHDSNDEGYDGNDYPDDVSNKSVNDSDDYRDADA